MVSLDDALRHGGDLTREDLERKLEDGSAELWRGVRSEMVTERIGSTMSIWLGAGDLKEIVSLLPGIEARARAQGCAMAVLKGRRGWERALRASGYGVRDGFVWKALG